MNTKDLTGQKFGLFTVVGLHGTRRYPSGGSRRLWLCRCECGVESHVAGNNLTNDHTTSCGSKKHQYNYHGITNTGFYHVWENMIARCTRKTHPTWKYYGARGITVCDEWMNFAAFHRDMIEGYSEGLSIERTDNNAGYSKDNCRWIPRVEQSFNTRKTRHVTVDGVTMPAKHWAVKSGVPYPKLLYRLNRGWDHARAVSP